MAKYPTYPTLFDEVLQISISKLKKIGYLKPGSIIGGNLVWSTNGKETARIGITVNTLANFIELDCGVVFYNIVHQGFAYACH
jgi:hypothetical protein